MQFRFAIVMAIAAISRGFPIEDEGQNPEEIAGGFEGDIILTEDQEKMHGTTEREKYWPKGTMYYKISPEFNETQKKGIQRAIDSYHSRTCLRIIERTDEKNYVLFTPVGKGCNSFIGMKGGEQELRLAENECFTPTSGKIMHEIMHAFGFWHQQSDPKRDDYVTIHLENVNKTKAHNFNKYNSSVATDFGVGYDYGSIMHYPRDAFSINKKDTITPKDPNAEIGQRKGLSEKDIAKLHKMYNCNHDNKG